MPEGAAEDPRGHGSFDALRRLSFAHANGAERQEKRYHVERGIEDFVERGIEDLMVFT